MGNRPKKTIARPLWTQSPTPATIAAFRCRLRDLAGTYLSDDALHDSAVAVLAELRRRGCS